VCDEKNRFNKTEGYIGSALFRILAIAFFVTPLHGAVKKRKTSVKKQQRKMLQTPVKAMQIPEKNQRIA